MDGNRVIQKLLVTLLAQYHFVTLPEIFFLTQNLVWGLH